jgi:putative ABC transport system substrate-binding protein
MLPKLSRLAVLLNPNLGSHREALKAIQELAPRIRVQILPIEIRSAQETENGFLLLAKQRAEAVIVVTDPIFFEQRRQIADLALKGGLPCAGYEIAFADAGFLFSYGPHGFDFFKRTASYVDKILKGARSADLPVEQPTKFELVINLKTAKAIGQTIPPNVLLRADRVIE